MGVHSAFYTYFFVTTSTDYIFAVALIPGIDAFFSTSDAFSLPCDYIAIDLVFLFILLRGKPLVFVSP